MPIDPAPTERNPALDARIDQLAALLRDVYDRIQVNLHDPDVHRAVNTTHAYLYSVLVALLDSEQSQAVLALELTTHHAAFQRLLEATQ